MWRDAFHQWSIAWCGGANDHLDAWRQTVEHEAAGIVPNATWRFLRDSLAKALATDDFNRPAFDAGATAADDVTPKRGRSERWLDGGDWLDGRDWRGGRRRER
jgi:hypothetical protein